MLSFGAEVYALAGRPFVAVPILGPWGSIVVVLGLGTAGLVASQMQNRRAKR